LFDDVLDICGDVHPLEHAVTIGRTRRTVADGTVVDCRTALICTVFLRLFPWQSYRYHTSCGSSPTCRRVGAACLRMCSFPPPGCEGGFRGQVQLYHVHNHRLYLPGFSFTRGTILRWERYICRPVSKARTLSCTNRLVREARCMRRSAGVPACSLQVSSCTRFISGRFLRVELACKLVFKFP